VFCADEKVAPTLRTKYDELSAAIDKLEASSTSPARVRKPSTNEKPSLVDSSNDSESSDQTKSAGDDNVDKKSKSPRPLSAPVGALQSINKQESSAPSGEPTTSPRPRKDITNGGELSPAVRGLL